MKATRKNFQQALKPKSPLRRSGEKESLAELARRFEVHPVMISKWKQKFIEQGAEVFEKKKEDQEILGYNITPSDQLVRYKSNKKD